ncbi:MAG: SMC-Scp complex subunit ScpB [Mycobacteriaceae bacterium]|nr:SMC-Scp complex subunit ScpB [Mycobacteriaceae bacterium]
MMLQDRDVAGVSEVDGAAEARPEPALPPGVELATLASQIEAIVVTSGRPVPVRRLGQALGLIAPDENGRSGETPAPHLNKAGETPAHQSNAGEAIGVVSPQSETDAAGEAEVVVKPKRGRRRAGGAGVDPERVIAAAVGLLNGVYRESGRTFSIELLAGGYRLMTLPAWRSVIASFHGLNAQQRLSKASVETLAIIAYKQPITRARLEAIRGVACGEVLRSLIERRLVTISGRAEELGRPMLYGTTKGFLEAFGLASLKDLPSAAEMAVLRRQ